MTGKTSSALLPCVAQVRWPRRHFFGGRMEEAGGAGPQEIGVAHSNEDRLQVTELQSTSPTDLRDYIAMVKALTQYGYRCASFVDYEPENLDLILRHDVDIDIESAVEMAAAEAGEGWRSTYFVLVSSEFYNLSSRFGRGAVADILSAGHEIGLHFDPAAYAPGADLDAVAAKECDMLEQIAGRAVQVTAVHRPSAAAPQFLGRAANFANRPHAYQPRYFSPQSYVSDGAGWWSHGHPLDRVVSGHGRGLQVLTHPHLWTHAPCPGRDVRLRQLLDERMKFLEKEVRRNFRDFGSGGAGGN